MELEQMDVTGVNEQYYNPNEGEEMPLYFVWYSEGEIWVLEGILDGDSLRRIECQQLFDQVEELTIDIIGRRDDFRQTSAGSYILLTLPTRFGFWPVKFTLLEKLWLRASTSPGEPFWHLSHNLFHHG